MSELTNILNEIEQTDPQASEQLLPLLYGHLHTLAARRLKREKPGQTLSATALVHEVYLRLVDVKCVQRWDSHGHFFSAAAEAMRRILVEQHRRKRTLKRGGDREQVPLREIEMEPRSADLLALDEALAELSELDLQAVKVVELRYFAGLGHEQVAETLNITTYRARQKWTYARAWLRDHLRK